MGNTGKHFKKHSHSTTGHSKSQLEYLSTFPKIKTSQTIRFPAERRSAVQTSLEFLLMCSVAHCEINRAPARAATRFSRPTALSSRGVLLAPEGHHTEGCLTVRLRLTRFAVHQPVKGSQWPLSWTRRCHRVVGLGLGVVVLVVGVQAIQNVWLLGCRLHGSGS